MFRKYINNSCNPSILSTPNPVKRRSTKNRRQHNTRPSNQPNNNLPNLHPPKAPLRLLDLQIPRTQFRRPPPPNKLKNKMPKPRPNPRRKRKFPLTRTVKIHRSLQKSHFKLPRSLSNSPRKRQYKRIRTKLHPSPQHVRIHRPNPRPRSLLLQPRIHQHAQIPRKKTTKTPQTIPKTLPQSLHELPRPRNDLQKPTRPPRRRHPHPQKKKKSTKINRIHLLLIIIEY